jgi:hypothetical protein
VHKISPIFDPRDDGEVGLRLDAREESRHLTVGGEGGGVALWMGAGAVARERA